MGPQDEEAGAGTKAACSCWLMPRATALPAQTEPHDSVSATAGATSTGETDATNKDEDEEDEEEDDGEDNEDAEKRPETNRSLPSRPSPIPIVLAWPAVPPTVVATPAAQEGTSQSSGHGSGSGHVRRRMRARPRDLWPAPEAARASAWPRDSASFRAQLAELGCGDHLEEAKRPATSHANVPSSEHGSELESSRGHSFRTCAANATIAAAITASLLGLRGAASMSSAGVPCST
mmetsp:Transcript_58268/g.189961  ORF Transcript_58268/g.189961 Transcript_58268/m.189961 type:complete len:234 (+) Transcript_58268:2644-3345(+)